MDVTAHVGADAASAPMFDATDRAIESITMPLWVTAGAVSYIAFGIVGSVMTGLSYFIAKAQFIRQAAAASAPKA